jgi:hypothetical protein
MHSKGQGLLASLLMFIPLLAVPFVASFGVPWLAAKAKEEGMPLSQLANPSPLKAGIGHSKTGMHSADDLFAPVARQAAVDLRFAPHGSPASLQNPHLRNASLVISHDAALVDPFESLQSSQAQAGAAGDSERPAAENPLDGWAVKEDPAESTAGDAPAPRVFPESAASVGVPPATGNPFAEFESTASPPAKAPAMEVAVSENAFDDPIEKSRSPADPDAFDPIRPLFKQEDARQTPAATRPPAAREHIAIPAKVSANEGNNVQESREPLTWETARIRLKELGITKYYVQQDATGRVFNFHCAYGPPDNPRVTRLFEAEATEPLEAVRKVLVQVENWKQRASVHPN